MTLAELIAARRAELAPAITAYRAAQDALVALRSDPNLTEPAVTAAIATRDTADAAVKRTQGLLDELLAEQARDAELAELERRAVPTGAPERPAYDQVGRVTGEQRTYAAHKERGFDQKNGQFRRNAKPGLQFERDVMSLVLSPHDVEARDRLARHMQEERVERRGTKYENFEARAVGTGGFSGLVIPQYLTDMYAPATAALRPFADVCEAHELPPEGMSVNLGRVTTPTAVALQASENTAVTEQNLNMTLLTINVQTAAGQQTLSRQAIERGTGIEPLVLTDLFRRWATTLDSTLINQATTGLTNVANAVTYTSATPTVAGFYPNIPAALSALEAAMLNLASGDNIALMHSRRWYWMQNALAATWPLIAQPGIPFRDLGTNDGVSYGKGLRGTLPNATPVIVDNNVPTNLGAGTNQDEVYLVDRHECHLWEDPDAPMYIRAEQAQLANLGVLMVVYSYFAYTMARYPSAPQKISGTGLITPTFTGS